MSCLNSSCSEVPIVHPLKAGPAGRGATLRSMLYRRLAGVALALTLGGVAAGNLGCSRTPGPNDFETRMTIEILEGATSLGVGGFSPNPAVCTRGTLVLWTNRDTVDHRVVSIGGFFDSGIIKPGQSYQHIFRDIGNFRYHDEVPSSSIQGVLNVID